LSESSRSAAPERRSPAQAAEAVAAERIRVQDRLRWIQPQPSRKSQWRRRKAAQREDEEAQRFISPEWAGRCFNCGRGGHRKVDCIFETLCIRCDQEGHEAKDCKRPRSPESEEELRRIALAKMARRASPPNLLRAAPPLEPRAPHVEVGGPSSERRVAPPAALPVEDQGETPLCVVSRTAGMRDLERRLQFALVAYVGGGRPLVSTRLVQEALVQRLRLPREGFSVHTYRPEDFLIVFASVELRNRVTARPALEHAGVQLFFRKWTRLAQASFEI
jgi:hypothetical protein